MGRPRLRQTVRGLMATVFLLALMTWAVRLAYLSSAYQSRAREMAARAEMARFDFAPYESMDSPTAGDAKLHAGYKRQMEHYLSLVRKYQQASRRPWVRLQPDPPVPGLINTGDIKVENVGGVQVPETVDDESANIYVE